MKYKVLQENVFDGYSVGDIIEREPHAMEYHLERGQCEVVDTSPAPIEVAKPDVRKVSRTKRSK
jgi:hypothetical protein